MIRDEILKKWLLDKKTGLVDATINLISEDAPKNKFSIIAGKLKMVEEFESEMDDLIQKSQG